jgi:hypothetical protein
MYIVSFVIELTVYIMFSETEPSGVHAEYFRKLWIF